MRSRLKQQVEKSGMKQVELANLTGVKAQTISRQCIAGIKSIRVAKRYAAVLNCNPLDIIEL